MITIPDRTTSGFFAALAIALFVGFSQVAEASNVVLILVDDLGWGDLGCYGSEYHETPNIDRLASEGMRFNQAYAACAVCSPTRAAVMTGRHPARLGITDWIRWRDEMPADRKAPSGYVTRADRLLSCPRNALWMGHEEVTLAEVVKPVDYVTGYIGKWHLGFEPWYPETQGFDVNLGGCELGQPPSYFDPYYKDRRGNIPTLAARQTGEYLTDREGDEAVEFLRRHTDRPFFLCYAPYAVHTPIQAKEELVESYRRKRTTHQKDATYAAMLQSLDESVGKILAALAELGLADRTLVLFTSDNGGLLGPTSNSPLRSGKGFPYEGGIRVPLIARWPGVVEPGVVSEEPVTSVDLFPTIVEATGAKLPTGRPIDGVSLVAHLRSHGESRFRRNLYWHFPHYRYEKVRPYSIVRSGDWKLVQFWEGPTFELYNLTEDPAEATDLAATNPQKVAELRRKLATHLTAVGAKVPRETLASDGGVFRRQQAEFEGGVAFTEGPAWHPSGNVYFSDTAGNRILRRDPKGKIHVYRTPAGRANGLLFDRQGRLIACEGSGEGGNRRVTRTELDGSLTVLSDSFQGKRYNGPNDLAIDSRGRIYFTDPRYGERDDLEILDVSGRPVEGVYRIDTGGSVERLLAHEVDRPNGIAVSANDRWLFVVDNNNSVPRGNRKVWRFALVGDGKVNLESRKLLYDFGKGRGGDGMALDREGRLYIAAGAVSPNLPRESIDVKPGIYVLSPEGEHIDFLSVPHDLVTNCTFGGPDLKTLYITAGHRLLSVPVGTAGYLAWPPR